MPRLVSLGLAAMLAVSASALAHDHRAGDIRIDHPYARPTVAAQSTGAAYLSIENHGKKADQLVSVSSPASASAEIHSMSMHGNVMKMREVPEIEIKPQQKIIMSPGDGYHIMLLGLKQPLKSGDEFPLILNFKHAGKVETKIVVKEKPAASNSANHGSMHGH